ncbi:unnamed protein product [Pleuronectes platessa]|uniref:Uncharacterized protein n=1 Tax=Pleuronectes platessa TaxID=8262 RepID=A0A9N7VL45_PLEPL|nr:unnamed protein product [Pleuronectes platessa]
MTPVERAKRACCLPTSAYLPEGQEMKCFTRPRRASEGGAPPLESNKQPSTAAQEAPNELLSTQFHSEFSEECLNNEAAKCNSAEDVRPKARCSQRSLLKVSGELTWMFLGPASPVDLLNRPRENV